MKYILTRINEKTQNTIRDQVYRWAMSAKSRYKEQWEEIIKTNPEFDIDSYKDCSEGGTKEQCGICHKWFLSKDLSVEISTGYCKKCCSDPKNSDIINEI